MKQFFTYVSALEYTITFLASQLMKTLGTAFNLSIVVLNRIIPTQELGCHELFGYYFL